MIWCVAFGVFGHFQIYRAAVTISAMPHSQPPQNKNELRHKSNQKKLGHKSHHKTKMSWATEEQKCQTSGIQ